MTPLLVLAAGLAVGFLLQRGRRGAARGRLTSRAVPTGWTAPGWWVRLLRQGDVELDPPVVLLAWSGGSVLAALLGALVGGPGAALVSFVTACGVPLVVLHLRAGRSDTRLAERLPGLLEDLASAARASTALPDALRAAAATSTGSTALDDDLARCRHELDHGVGLAAAVRNWSGWRPLPEVRLAAAAIALGAETGGSRAQSLDAVAATLRERAAVGREVVALSAQARASATVIIAAPVVFAALGLLSSPGVASFLFRTPAGLGCLVAGLGLDAVAAVWITRLARPPS